MWKKRVKYNAQKVEYDGHKFASKKEGARYLELKLLEKAGELSELRLQPKFKIQVEGQHICYYIADFIYKGREEKEVVEDVKGFKTPVYKLKKRLFLAIYGDIYEFREI